MLFRSGQKILDDIGTVHEVRYVSFDDDTRLLLATSFDGDWDVYIDDFFRTKVLTYWSSFLIHCEGAPDDLAGAAALSADDWKEFLTAYQVTAIEYRRTSPDLTVKQILKAALGKDDGTLAERRAAGPIAGPR